jgi:hypothetical protein
LITIAPSALRAERVHRSPDGKGARKRRMPGMCALGKHRNVISSGRGLRQSALVRPMSLHSAYAGREGDRDTRRSSRRLPMGRTSYSLLVARLLVEMGSTCECVVDAGDLGVQTQT